VLIQEIPAQVADNLWMLGSYEYPLYLFWGDGEAALFEGGTSAVGPLVCRQLEELGVGREMLTQMVIPHAHPDHVMAVPLFREVFPNLTVLASQPAAATLAMEKAIAQFCQVDDAITDALLRAGSITQQPRRPLAENRIAVDRTLKEGDAVAVAGVAFQVLETPGHSECSLSFHQPQRGVLLVSDAVGYHAQQIDYWWPNYFSGYQAYLASIERLAGLKAEVLCLGHHGVVRGAGDVQSYLADAAAAAQHYHQRIVEQLRAGCPVRQLAEQLGSEVYQKMPMLPVEFFQKNCGVLVKQSARQQGISV
jgi:glyoxylase-like metal-dependent hydrolase (beta-lactamase superfamily II)